MFFSNKKIIDRSAYLAVPALVSLINLFNFVAVPILTSFDEFNYFVAANVYAGFYLTFVAMGAHNISAVQLAGKDSQVLPTYQALSILVVIFFIPISFLLKDPSVLILAFAYFVQQQIVIMVMFARNDFDGVRAKTYLLIQPFLLSLFLIILSFIGIKKFWIHASLLSALLGAGAIMRLEKVSYKALLPNLPNSRESINKTLLILISGSAVPSFIHLDMLLFRDSENLAEFAIFGKFAYSIPMALSSLLIYRVFRDRRFLSQAQSLLLLSFVALLSTASWFAYSSITNFAFHPSFFLVFFYTLVFGLFNFVFAVSMLEKPAFASKLAFISTFILSSLLLGNFSILNYMIIKIVMMTLITLIFLNKLRKSFL